jgi:Protein of unknwon function (DUF3310)
VTTTGLAEEGVAHPRHYNVHPSGVECNVIKRALPANLSDTLKYLWRMNEKGHPVKDLEKAVWYLRDEEAFAAKDPAYLRQLVSFVRWRAPDLTMELRAVGVAERAHVGQTALYVFVRELHALLLALVHVDGAPPRDAAAHFFRTTLLATELAIEDRRLARASTLPSPPGDPHE